MNKLNKLGHAQIGSIHPFFTKSKLNGCQTSSKGVLLINTIV